jgi:hypothetical protein
MTHCSEGRGVGMRPPNQQAPLYAGVAEMIRSPLVRQQSPVAVQRSCAPAAYSNSKCNGQHHVPPVEMVFNIMLAAGNTCEPWMARFAIVMLDQLLTTGGVIWHPPYAVGALLSTSFTCVTNVRVPLANMGSAACYP